MKFLKYFAIVLVIVAIIAAVIRLQREAIVRELANSVLRDRGFAATELSIDELGTGYVRLGRLVLLQDDGTRYDISGISFPLHLPSVAAERIDVDAVAVTPARRNNAPPRPASVLHTVMEMPARVPRTTVAVARLTIPDVPAIDDIVWQPTADGQHVSFTIETASFDIDTGAGDDSYRIVIDAMAGGRADALSLPLTVHAREAGFAISGQASVRTDAWLPLLRKLGFVPESLAMLTARLQGPVSVEVDDDAEDPVRLQAGLAVPDGASAEIVADTGYPVRVQAATADPLRLTVAYPSLQWSAALVHGDLRLAAGASTEVPVQLRDVACRNGIRCTLSASLAAGPVQFEDIAVDSMQAAASLAVTVDQTIRIDVAPDATLRLGGLELGDMTAASLSAGGISGGRLTTGDGGWSGDAEHLDLLLESVSDGGDLHATLPLSVSALRLRDGAGRIEAAFSLDTTGAALSWGGTGFVVPQVDGTLALRDDTVSASFTARGSKGGLSARIDVSRNLPSGTGTLFVHDAVLDFGKRKMSGRLLRWPYPWDIVAGSGTAELGIRWSPGNDGTQFSGDLRLGVNGLAGNYNDVVFTGLTTTVAAALDPAKGLDIPRTQVSVALLEIGVPIEKVEAEFDFHGVEKALDVSRMSASILGGTMSTDPFRYSMQESSNDIMLRLKSIQLQFMVDLAEFEDIQLEGSMSGVLPVRLSGTTVTITDGRLESDPPGGVIRYLPGTIVADDDTAESNVNLVSRALGNFRFDSLSSDVNYTEQGDLKLKMRLTGMNPDMDARQPVIVNLGVENNVPELLRSLRATRAIEDILRKRTGN